MNVLEGLKNYFLGTDIIEYCSRVSEEFPEKTQELRRKRNIYVTLGKALPDALDIGGLVLALAFNKFGMGGVAIGVAEGVRLTYNDFYLNLKLDVEFWKSEKIYQRLMSAFREHERVHQEMPEIPSE